MTMICKLYADGGVIEKNPSPVGGTWAWVMTDEHDERVAFGQGHISNADAGLSVTNNLSEMLALIYGLERLPMFFAGTVYSDSAIALGRLFMGWQWRNVPGWVHKRYRAARERFFDWDAIRFCLLAGHPTTRQIEAGEKRGRPVSRWQVECDRLCHEAGQNFLAGYG